MSPRRGAGEDGLLYALSEELRRYPDCYEDKNIYEDYVFVLDANGKDFADFYLQRCVSPQFSAIECH